MSEAKIDEFPCIFPASREFRVSRDGFARDCLLQQRVCEPSVIGAVTRGAATRNTVTFGGIVRLPVADARWEKPAAPESGCRRNFGHIVPRAEGGIASRAILVGIEVMTTELEMVVDPTVGGEETRRMTR